MVILPVHPKVQEYAAKRNLSKKLAKQVKFLENDPKYPSLNTELLEPRDKGIYSFRIDRKYRGLFIYRDDLRAIEILAITDHYQ